ncbi:MAG: hypothetical protein K6A43_12270 [Treponema sp.]|nr:hypothetical protein [Treponema sp.]
MKINRFLFAVVFTFSILLFSCRFNDSNNSEPNKESTPTIKLSVNQDQSRTAWPAMNVNIITTYSLTGTLLNASDQTVTSISKTWNSTGTSPAYELMTADELVVSLGTWSFTLLAYVKEGDITLASYSGTTEIEISGGQNSLSFNLKLQQVDVSSGAGSGNLTIKLNFGAANVAKKIKAHLFTENENERTLVAGSTKVLQTADANSDGFIDVTTPSVPYIYSVPDLPAGSYIAQFEFYGDEQMEVLLGSYVEAVNINLLGAVSTITLNKLDSSYAISYYEYILGQTSNSPVAISSNVTNSNPVSYTRHSEFNFEVPVKAGYTFWKWIQIGQNDTAIAITSPAVNGIAKKSIGNRYYCAIFIPEEDAAQIDSVAFTGTAKVGHTLTATAKVGDSDFEGTVEKIVWSAVDAESGEETVIKTVTENCESSDSYIVEPVFAEKTIKVQFVQKYHIQKTGNSITSVASTEG